MRTLKEITEMRDLIKNDYWQAVEELNNIRLSVNFDREEYDAQDKLVCSLYDKLSAIDWVLGEVKHL